jgi:hypothetical protein
MPARLAGGLGLGSDLAGGSRRPAPRPGSDRELVPPHAAYESHV